MNLNDIKNVSVIGAGTMGHGIAQVFASKGYAVHLFDVKDEFLSKAIENIKSNLSMMKQEGLKLDDELETIVSRINKTTSMEQATAGAHFVVEAVPENLELKQDIFKELDQLCSPDVILASNTSAISITEIASQSKNRQRIVGTHFWYPPYLIPLVEVVKGVDTSDRTMQTVYDFLQQVCKHPIKVLKDVPGFVANRLQHALSREAISIVENGIADAATVDEAVKNGFAIRLPVLGPLEHTDMAGLDLTLSIHDYLLKSLDSHPGPSPLLKRKVEKGELGFKSGKGFYNWTPQEAQKFRDRLNKYLLNWLKNQQENM